jgi:hypothetical protein
MMEKLAQAGGGGGARPPPLFNLFTITCFYTKLQCTLLLRGKIHSSELVPPAPSLARGVNSDDRRESLTLCTLDANNIMIVEMQGLQR